MGAAILFANSLPAAVNGLQTAQSVDDVKSLLCKPDERRAPASTASLIVRRRGQIGAHFNERKWTLVNDDDTDRCRFAQVTACLQNLVPRPS
jgi:hypothetical protein